MSIKDILKGIDQDLTYSDSGWWETSAGSEFGKLVLSQALNLESELKAKNADLEKELTTLKASIPKIKADAVFECAPMPKWGGQPDDIPADFDGYCQAIHDVHENANKLEAGE